MKMSKFIEKFNNTLKDGNRLCIYFKDGFFVADEISFISFNKEIIFLKLEGKLIGRISLSKVKEIEEY